MENILTKKRQGMMPQLAEALVFLKVNQQRFGGMGEVVRAMGMARSSMYEERQRKYAEQAAADLEEMNEYY
jgi:hypothetical protein